MADYYMCPGCGKDIKVGAKGCPECDHLDPWEIEETEVYDGMGEFDHEDDQSLPSKHKTTELPKFWIGVALVMFFVFLLIGVGILACGGWGLFGQSN